MESLHPCLPVLSYTMTEAEYHDGMRIGILGCEEYIYLSSPREIYSQSATQVLHQLYNYFVRHQHVPVLTVLNPARPTSLPRQILWLLRSLKTDPKPVLEKALQWQEEKILTPQAQRPLRLGQHSSASVQSTIPTRRSKRKHGSTQQWSLVPRVSLLLDSNLSSLC